jgi:hypothetical protein
VREFITHGDNGLLTPPLEPRALASAILGVLENKPLTLKLRANARAYAERRLAMADYLGAYCGLIGRLTGENPAPAAEPVPAAKVPSPKAPSLKSEPSQSARRRPKSGSGGVPARRLAVG